MTKETNRKMIRILSIIISVIVVAAAGTVCAIIIKNTNKSSEETTTSNETSAETTAQADDPDGDLTLVTTAADTMPRDTKIRLRYWNFLKDGELTEVCASEPEYEGIEGNVTMNLNDDPWGFAFCYFDIDQDGTEELMVCDGSFYNGLDEWHRVMIFKYVPSDDSVALCGCLYGIHDLLYSPEKKMLRNAEYRLSYNYGFEDFYKLEGYELNKKYTVSYDRNADGSDADGNPIYYKRDVSSDVQEPIKISDYLEGYEAIGYYNELPEDYAIEFGYGPYDQ
ncbi:MAG: hypothetical protein K5756_06520 [Clostridiales bacterium]|nr:hypothetical protein [Clostridiales bacterium]